MFLWNEDAYFQVTGIFWSQKEIKKDKGNILNKNKKVF